MRWIIGSVMLLLLFFGWLFWQVVGTYLVNGGAILGLIAVLALLAWLGHRYTSFKWFGWAIGGILLALFAWSWVVTPLINRTQKSNPQTTRSLARSGKYQDYNLSEKIDPLALEGHMKVIEYCRVKEREQVRLLESELNKLTAVLMSKGTLSREEQVREAAALKSFADIAEERRICQKEREKAVKKDDRKEDKAAAIASGPDIGKMFQASPPFRMVLWLAVIGLAVAAVLCVVGFRKMGGIIALAAVLAVLLVVAHAFIWDTDAAAKKAKGVLSKIDVVPPSASAAVPAERPGEIAHLIQPVRASDGSVSVRHLFPACSRATMDGENAENVLVTFSDGTKDKIGVEKEHGKKKPITFEIESGQATVDIWLSNIGGNCQKKQKT